MRGQLSHFSLLNRRFAAFMRRCPVEVYLKTSGLHHELSAVERRIDGYIDLLRKDEFKEDVGPSNLYARTKLATLLFTKGLVEKTSLGDADKTSIAVFATHPGVSETFAGLLHSPTDRPFIHRPSAPVSRTSSSLPTER